MHGLPLHLPDIPSGQTFIVGAGKAADHMSQAVEAHYMGVQTGQVVTRYVHALPTRTIKVLEAGHPVPDAAGELIEDD